ncbi:hypothetical protein [Embleya sp. NBC_00888]|uniref:hypothetical protein n=1 Tax=Embleya sp. NBC_00888 TaxID=2975960 RepID=UPI00386B4687
MIGLAQLYRRDVPDLPTGPGGCDLLQVFWCPLKVHGPGRYDLALHLRRRRSSEVGEVPTLQPRPPVVESDGFVPGPCVLHLEQVVTYPFADPDFLPEDLCARIEGWDAAQEKAEQSTDGSAAEPTGYRYDLSIPPGRRVGGFASWHATDPYPMDCRTCGTPMRLLPTIDSSEWDGGSWKPLEDRLPAHRCAPRPPKSPRADSANSTSSPAPPLPTIRTAGASSSSGMAAPCPVRRSAYRRARVPSLLMNIEHDAPPTPSKVLYRCCRLS